MGFSSIATGAAAALPKVFEATGAASQAKALRRAAAEQERVSAAQAEAIEATATANQIRGSRNAQAQLGHARADAAVSNTMQEGSTYKRGVDLATRLQDDINAAANEQLQRAGSIRRQSAYDAWDLRNQARQSKAQAIGAAASAVGGLFMGMADGLGGGGGDSGGSGGGGGEE